MAWYASLLTALLQRNTLMRLKLVVSIGLREAHKCCDASGLAYLGKF
jgi:hypothetical protein